MNLGAVLAALSAGLFAAFLGRKAGLWAACVLSAVAVAVQIGTTSTAGLYTGRLLLGFANGFLVPFSTVYMSETAPAHLRGYVLAFRFEFIEVLDGWKEGFGCAVWLLCVFCTVLGAVVGDYMKVYVDERSYRYVCMVD